MQLREGVCGRGSQGVPPAMRQQACRIVGGKTALLARVDASAGDPSGTQGAQMKDTIRDKLDKLQEPPPAKQPKVCCYIIMIHTSSLAHQAPPAKQPKMRCHVTPTSVIRTSHFLQRIC